MDGQGQINIGAGGATAASFSLHTPGKSLHCPPGAHTDHLKLEVVTVGDHHNLASVTTGSWP